MPLSLLNIFLIIAASQGFFLAMVIYFRHGTLFANRFLALYILVYSLIISILNVDFIQDQWGALPIFGMEYEF